MENPILQRKRMVQSRIEKSFMDGISIKDAEEAEEILKGIDADNEFFEKARHGIYEDNAENRRKNRVGQEYGHAAQQKEPTGKTAGGGKTVDEHAAGASDKALERAAADKNASKEVKDAAKKELQKRDSNKTDNFKLDDSILDEKNGGLNGNHPFVKKMWALDKKVENKTATPEEKKTFMKMRRAVNNFMEEKDDEFSGITKEERRQMEKEGRKRDREEERKEKKEWREANKEAARDKRDEMKGRKESLKRHLGLD